MAFFAIHCYRGSTSRSTVAPACRARWPLGCKRPSAGYNQLTARAACAGPWRRSALKDVIFSEADLLTIMSEPVAWGGPAALIGRAGVGMRSGALHARTVECVKAVGVRRTSALLARWTRVAVSHRTANSVHVQRTHVRHTSPHARVAGSCPARAVAWQRRARATGPCLAPV